MPGSGMGGGEGGAGVYASSRFDAERRMSVYVETATQPHEVWLRNIGERTKGKCVLMVLYLAIVLAIVLFFTYTPLYAADVAHGARNESLWRRACDLNDRAMLGPLGLS